MPKQSFLEILQTDLLEHPAVRAWSRLQPERVEPKEIVLLERNNKSKIYQLVNVGPGGSAVVAKYCKRSIALLERTTYQEILPRLPVKSLQFYGFVEGDADFDWLFLEYVDGERYSNDVREHRELGARWLSRLHSSAAGLNLAGRLPDLGPSHHLGILRLTRRRLLPVLSDPALKSEDAAVLNSIVRQCDLLESRWDHVEKWCAGVPETLLHGDFKPDNLRIRTGPAGAALVPFDWEMVGWGVPARDLFHVDLGLYHSLVRNSWPGLDIAAVKKLWIVGTLFRRLTAIGWTIERLVPRPFEFEMSCLRSYQADIAEAIRIAGWG